MMDCSVGTNNNELLIHTATQTGRRHHQWLVYSYEPGYTKTKKYS